MKSMTGFGAGDAALGTGRVVVEIRSLNHRYLDVRVRVPPELLEHTVFVEQLARGSLDRGRYDLGVRLEGNVLPPPRLSRERIAALYADLVALASELSPGAAVSIESLLSLPEMFESRGLAEPEAVRSSLAAAIAGARAALDVMRSDEGAALARDLSSRVALARATISRMEQSAPALVDAQRRRLRARIERLLDGQGIEADPGRLETEIALLSERSDVSEELVRLASHLDQFEALLEMPEAVGRRLDFLLQEIGREINTLGSKSQDAEVAHIVVELKAEIERIREQVQNVE